MDRDSAWKYVVLGLKFGLDGSISTLPAIDEAMATTVAKAISDDYDAVIIYKLHKVVV